MDGVALSMDVDYPTTGVQTYYMIYRYDLHRLEIFDVEWCADFPNEAAVNIQ